MISIELSGEQNQVLDEILQHAFTTLEVEISRSDNIEFKRQLKHRRDIVADLLAKLRPEVPVSV